MFELIEKCRKLKEFDAIKPNNLEEKFQNIKEAKSLKEKLTEIERFASHAKNHLKAGVSDITPARKIHSAVSKIRQE